MAKASNTTFPREGPCSAGESLTVAVVGEKSSTVATVCPTYTGGATNAIDGVQTKTTSEESGRPKEIRRSERFKRPVTPAPPKKTTRRPASPCSSVASTTDLDLDSDDYEDHLDRIMTGIENDAKRKSQPGLNKSKGQRELQLVLSRFDLQKEGPDDCYYQALADQKRKSLPDAEEGYTSSATDVTEPAAMGVEDMRHEAFRLASNIVQTAQKSSNLKGTCLKTFKESATGLLGLVNTMASRTETSENRRLTNEVANLRAEVERLKGELDSSKKEFQKLLEKAMSKPPAPAPEPVATEAKKVEDLIKSALEEAKASFTTTLGAIFDARLANLEERLPPSKPLRPPVNVGNKKKTADTPTANTTPGPSTAPEPSSTPAPSRESWATVAKKKNVKKKAAPARTPAAPATTPAAPASTPAAPDTNGTERRPKRKRKRKSRVARPRAAAVVITLQPQAVESGVTYLKVLERASRAINLGDLGISGLKVRKTLTGARVLELDKKDAAEKADNFAKKLQDALSDVATVTRPVTLIDVRLTGLDDSVTQEKVAAAIADLGRCPVQQIRVSEIRPGPGGVGTAVAKCPAAAAKALDDAGRLLVGWSAARAVVLKKLPLRCFKCLGLGHTAPLCPSSKSRAGLCFRCGKEGHKSAACLELPHCAVCADAGKPCGHVMGGQACRPPPVKGKSVSPAAGHSGESPMSVG